MLEYRVPGTVEVHGVGLQNGLKANALPLPFPSFLNTWMPLFGELVAGHFRKVCWRVGFSFLQMIKSTGTAVRPYGPRKGSQNLGIYTIFQDMRDLYSAKYYPERVLKWEFNPWRPQVEQFTLRRFTDQSDILWGIFKLLRSHFPKRYIWGLPRDALDAMLLWEVDCSLHPQSVLHVIPEAGKGLRRMVIPSWTWLAKCFNVEYSSCSDLVASKVT
jgi:hypothetical protein